jgi:UDP-3-O-acyl-N-acetylglucosamine deacetylase
MLHHKTFAEEFTLTGRDPYGGLPIDVTFSPSTEGKIRILSPEHSEGIEAKLSNAIEKNKAISLKDPSSEVEISMPEHILATCLAYGISSANIYVERTHRGRYLAWKKIQGFPYFDKRQLSVCKEIENVGIRELEERPEFILTRAFDAVTIGPIQERKVGTPYFRMTPESGGQRTFKIKTKYSSIPEQNFESSFEGGDWYKDEISWARSYGRASLGISHRISQACMIVGGGLLGRGFGQNLGRDTTLYPPPRLGSDSWEDLDGAYCEEAKPHEIARHRVMDFMGALALLEGELGGSLVGFELDSFLMGHREDLLYFNKMLDEGYFRRVEDHRKVS